ncbi:MAG: DUF4386 domain-containing protein [bacterium]|nr:DUF4386 domain-containing protein [bacterium]
MSLKNSGRIAGFLFIFTFAVSFFLGGILFPNFIAKDVLVTSGNIINNEFLFRFCIITELISCFATLVFALLLYSIFKSVNKNIALFAVFLKLMEAALLAVVTLGHYIALLLLKKQFSIGGLESIQVQSFAGLFVNMHFNLGTFNMIFHGANLMIFLYLFFKSNYIPKILAGFGIFSYVLIFLYALMTILFPDYSNILIIQIIFFVPSILSELIIGSWLIIKGINLNK